MKSVLNDLSKLSTDGMEAMLKLAKPVTFRKKQIIYQEGEIAQKLYFIHKGIVMAYYYVDDKLTIDRFIKEGEFIGGQVSYSTKIPSNLTFVTLEESVMLELDANSFLKLCADSHEIQSVYSLYLTQHFKRYSDMIVAFRALTAEDKYAKFMELYGTLVNRISLRNIAIFLGMKHETLSRIRSRMGK